LTLVFVTAREAEPVTHPAGLKDSRDLLLGLGNELLDSSLVAVDDFTSILQVNTEHNFSLLNSRVCDFDGRFVLESLIEVLVDLGIVKDWSTLVQVIQVAHCWVNNAFSVGAELFDCDRNRLVETRGEGRCLLLSDLC